MIAFLFPANPTSAWLFSDHFDLDQTETPRNNDDSHWDRLHTAILHLNIGPDDGMDLDTLNLDRLDSGDWDAFLLHLETADRVEVIKMLKEFQEESQ